jgi:hypothetical protein
MSEICSNGLKPPRFAANFMIECQRDSSRTIERAHSRRGEISRSLVCHGLREYNQMSIDKSDAI